MGVSSYQAQRLLTFLVRREAEGQTTDIWDIREHFNHCARSYAVAIIQQLRIQLKDTDTALVCIRPKDGGAHHYRLTGDYDVAEPWLSTRQRDIRTRLRTLVYSARALVKATDSTTQEGRTMRSVHLSLKRALEDLTGGEL